MAKNRNENDELDTETSFADMNVEGFSWYDKNKKDGKQPNKVSRKEYFQMVKAAYAAYLPLILILVGVCALLYLFARLWLG